MQSGKILGTRRFKVARPEEDVVIGTIKTSKGMPTTALINRPCQVHKIYCSEGATYTIMFDERNAYRPGFELKYGNYQYWRGYGCWKWSKRKATVNKEDVQKHVSTMSSIS